MFLPNSMEKIAVNTNIVKRGLKKLHNIPRMESLYFEDEEGYENMFD